MSKLYFTLTGTKYHHGKDFLEKEMQLNLVKEPDNEHDKEAIRVELPPLGTIGYVANSPYTVLGECLSAGRLYDRIGKKAIATVKLITEQGVICTVNKKKK